MHFRAYLIVLIFLSFTNCANVASHLSMNSKKNSRQKSTKSLHTHEELMDNLFIIYDPSFLSLVWPKIKNGVHLSLDRYCWGELSVFFKDYLDGRAWAYKTADASGRYSGSFFTGNKFWLGSKEQCRMLNEAYESRDENETWGEFYSGDYLNALLRREKPFGKNQQDWHGLVERDELMQRVVRSDNSPPFTLAFSALHLQLNLTQLSLAKGYYVTLGVCLPRSCDTDDILSIINFSIMLNDHLKSNNTLSRSVKITSIRQIQGYDIKNDVVAVLTILITIIFILLAVIATLVDLEIFAVNHKTLNLNINHIKDEFERNKSDTRPAKDRLKTDTRPVVVDAVMKNLNPGALKISDGKIPPSITLGVVHMEGNCRRCGKYKKQCAISRQFDFKNSCSLTTEYKSGSLKNLLLSFSLKQSWTRIFNTSMANKDLSVMHVAKIVVTLWIVFIHVAVTVNYISDSGDMHEHNTMYYILATGTLAFDTLFFVSGIFSAHHFFYLKGRGSGAGVEPSEGGCTGGSRRAGELLCFISNRAIRLLPPYMYTIFLASVLARVSHEGSALTLPQKDFVNCHVYWWRNVLYINNFYPREEQCMQISWYLSTETQLHMLGAVLCYLLTTSKKRFIALLAVLMLFVPTAFDVFTAFADNAFSMSDAFAAYADIITRPWSRVAPYFLGVLTGWLVHRIDGLLTVSKTSSVCLWLASLCAALGSCVGPWLGVGWAWGWAWGWLHLSWPLAWLWPAVVCSTKYAYRTRQLLDSRVTAGLSRLCYCTLLLHGPVAHYLLLSVDTALCAHFTCVLCYYAGVALMSLAGAFCVSALVEMPTCCFLRRLSHLLFRRR